MNHIKYFILHNSLCEILSNIIIQINLYKYPDNIPLKFKIHFPIFKKFSTIQMDHIYSIFHNSSCERRYTIYNQG